MKSDIYIHGCIRKLRTARSSCAVHFFTEKTSKADIRNPLSLLAHERSRFANCKCELLTPADISIPLIHSLVLYTLEAGDCLFCVQNDVKIVIFGKADMPGM